MTDKRDLSQRLLDAFIAADVAMNIIQAPMPPQVPTPAQKDAPIVQQVVPPAGHAHPASLDDLVSQLAEQQERLHEQQRDDAGRLGYQLREPDQVIPDPQRHPERGRK